MTTIARKASLLVAALLLTAGCETLNPVTLGAGIVSYATTGKGLADHAIGKLTQKDCNIIGGILSQERKICEPLGSAAAQRGFKGFFAQSPVVVDDEGTALRLSESIARLPPRMEFDQLRAVSAAGSSAEAVGYHRVVQWQYSAYSGPPRRGHLVSRRVGVVGPKRRPDSEARPPGHDPDRCTRLVLSHNPYSCFAYRSVGYFLQM